MRAFSKILRCEGGVQNPVSVGRLIIARRLIHYPPIPVAWKKPEKGWTKLNFDGSCRVKVGEALGKASIGGVFRNHEAGFLLGYAEPIGKSSSVGAEVAALRKGLELAVENQWRNIWIEGDNKTSVEMVVRRRAAVMGYQCAQLQENLSRIMLILPELDNVLATHVFREGNRTADRFAQMGHSLEWPQVWRHVPPDEVQRFMRDDAQGKVFLRRR